MRILLLTGHRCLLFMISATQELFEGSVENKNIHPSIYVTVSVSVIAKCSFTI